MNLIQVFKGKALNGDDQTDTVTGKAATNVAVSSVAFKTIDSITVIASKQQEMLILVLKILFLCLTPGPQLIMMPIQILLTYKLPQLSYGANQLQQICDLFGYY